MQKLMNRHIRIHQRRHGTSGTGHIYQGRFKSVAIEDERELLRVCRYVNANPLRAGLVDRAEEWPWSDLSRQATKDGASLLTDWPSPRPADWLDIVNRPQGEKMVNPIRSAIVRARRLVSVAKDDNS
jgi:putative transposase